MWKFNDEITLYQLFTVAVLGASENGDRNGSALGPTSLFHDTMSPSNAHFAALRAKKRKAAGNDTKSTDPVASTSASSSASSLKQQQQQRRKERRLGALNWHNIALPSEIGFDDAGGLLELDEVEGVDVVYGADGRISFQVSHPISPCEQIIRRRGPGRIIAEMSIAVDLS